MTLSSADFGPASKGNLKIKQEHYTAVRDEIIRTAPLVSNLSEKEKLKPRVWRWSVFRACTFDGRAYHYYMCDHLYDYIDDTHVDSALKRICG